MTRPSKPAAVTSPQLLWPTISIAIGVAVGLFLVYVFGVAQSIENTELRAVAQLLMAFVCSCTVIVLVVIATAVTWLNDRINAKQPDSADAATPEETP